MLCEGAYHRPLRTKHWREVRNQGGIDANGQEKVEEYPTELEAGQALEAVARAKRRSGYQDL